MMTTISDHYLDHLNILDATIKNEDLHDACEMHENSSTNRDNIYILFEAYVKRSRPVIRVKLLMMT